MRIIQYLIIVVALASCTSNQERQVQQEDSLLDGAGADTSTGHISTVNAETSISSVAGIQKSFQQTFELYKNRSLDSTSFKYDCNGETGGAVSYFTTNGNLRLIVHRYHEYDHHEAEDRYFVNEGSLYFAHTKSLAWSFDSGPEGATRDQITEQRSYLLNNAAVKCLEKKYEIRKHAGINPNPDSVPNKQVDCKKAKSTTSNFEKLKLYWKNEAPNCLAL